MTVSTLEGPREPRVGDLGACSSLTPSLPAKMHCEIKLQQHISGLEGDVIWNNFAYARSTHLQQGLLQQLKGLQDCSTMITRKMLEENIQYRYILRLRPDFVMINSFPLISSILQPDEQNVVKIVHKDYCCCGNEDWFGVGHFTAMQTYLQRISALYLLPKNFFTEEVWTAEMFLEKYLKTIYNITLVEEKALIGCIVKPTSRHSPSDP
jgi:hypothetical protein